MILGMVSFQRGYTNKPRSNYRPLYDGGKRGPKRLAAFHLPALIRGLLSNHLLHPTKGQSMLTLGPMAAVRESLNRGIASGP